MKQLFLTLVISFSGCCSYAQTNTFPSSGNVGLGTTSPSSQLELRDGSGLSIIASNARILFGDISNTMNLRMDNGSNLQVTNSLLSPLVSFMQGGNVGIGITSPTAKLHLINAYDTYTTSALKLLYQNTWGTPTYASNFRFLDIASTEGGNILELSGYGMGIGCDPPSYLSPDKLYINGNVAIGAPNAQGYKLAVNGSAIATSMTVKLYASWPDYVLKPTYKLRPLLEVKKYIDRNRHLPGMPSEVEVAKEGINLGEIVKIQTKKIEELTLYAIEQQNRIDELDKQQAKSKQQEARIAALEATLVKITAGK